MPHALLEPGVDLGERTAEEKHEFVNGQIITMAGGNWRHALIASRLVKALETALEGKPCESYGSDMKIHIPATGKHRYPDASVRTGKTQFYQKRWNMCSCGRP